jgi:general secretion pathway protein L
MSELLRIRIEADWPAESTQCEWAVYDIRGELVQRGRSEPQHWPAAESCELVLSADQCLVLEAQLPKGVKADDTKLVGYLVEDHLIGDIQGEHVVAGETRPDGATSVWVVSRARLNTVLAALRQLGRTPRRAFSELQLAPLEAEAWTACVRQGRGFVRLAAEAGFAFDLSGSDPPPELCLAMQAAQAQGRSPRHIDVYCGDEPRQNLEAWQAALGVPLASLGEFAWDAQPARTARNLLVGEFAPARGPHSGWAPFKPALALGATLLVLYSVFSLGEWIWMEQRASDLRLQTTEIFRSAFPEVQTIVDPVVQMRRLYDQQMRERGHLGEGDFLPLLAAVSNALAGQASYRRLGYEEGRLEFTVLLRNARAAEQLREALSRRGLTPTLRETRQTRGGVETSFSVRFGA